MTSESPAIAATDTDAPLLLGLDKNGVAVITLNRPRAFNSLSIGMVAALQAAIDEIAADDAVRAVVIRANGRGFCAGHDLKEITAHRSDADGGRGYYEALFAACTRMMLSLARLPVAVIAEVQGIATAAGCQLVATCDMAVASVAARFGVNGVDAGLFCSTPMVPLSRNIPRKVAMEMLVLGEMLDAEQAEALGLVNAVVGGEFLHDAAMGYAHRAAKKSRAVVALGKAAFYRQIEMSLEGAYEHTSKVIVDNLMLHDADEGIRAFIEKREPDWQDR